MSREKMKYQLHIGAVVSEEDLGELQEWKGDCDL